VPRPASGGIGGARGHNIKRDYLAGKPRPLGGELQKGLRNDSVEGFDETTARKSQVFIERGFELIEKFLETQSSN
jgi:hypothetical protein